MTAHESLHADLAAALAMILAERAARLAAEAEAARAVAENSNIDGLIATLKLQIEKLRRELYGSRSERKARLLDQIELELEELEAGATEEQIAAEQAGEVLVPGVRDDHPAAGAKNRSRRLIECAKESGHHLGSRKCSHCCPIAPETHPLTTDKELASAAHRRSSD